MFSRISPYPHPGGGVQRSVSNSLLWELVGLFCAVLIELLRLKIMVDQVRHIEISAAPDGDVFCSTVIFLV
jgi:hypothetical protein